MKLVRVGAGILNQTPLAWESNRNNIIDAIIEAVRSGVSILCLPELCVTGYGCEDQFHSYDLHKRAMEALFEIAEHVPSGMAVSVGVPVFHRNSLFNCAAFISEGQVLGFVAKQHLAGDGLHYEPRWFRPWPAGHREIATIELDEYPHKIPIGDLVFDFSGIKVGYEICEDAWVADRPGVKLAKKGVDVILNPSASHFAFRKFDIRKRFVTEGSRAYGVTYVYTNLLGNEAGRVIYDGGALIATGGKLVAQGPRFSFERYLITSAVVDIEATRVSQSRTTSFSPDFDDTSSYIKLQYGKVYWVNEAITQGTQLESWEESKYLKEEEFTRAIALALWDYARKSNSSGFVISLSGGADSAACAVLVYAMSLLATTSPKGFRDILTCVYQRTRNSSDITLNTAKGVAEELGCTFMNLNVQPIVDAYLDKVESAIGKVLTWDTDDIVLQNIQARVRSPGVWMLANIKNALLLATSNRSEAAVGYCTLDGDTSGSLSPIGGIDKDFLLRWLLAVQEGKVSCLPALKSLEAVTKQTPTAELRPRSQDQTDEKDLMPYSVLEYIEKAAIRDKRVPTEIDQLLSNQFPEVCKETRHEWVRKFFQKWSRNQFKRERLAPSFHVDDEDLDPRAWCRFPILSGGFVTELQELESDMGV